MGRYTERTREWLHAAIESAAEARRRAEQDVIRQTELIRELKQELDGRELVGLSVQLSALKTVRKIIFGYPGLDQAERKRLLDQFTDF